MVWWIGLAVGAATGVAAAWVVRGRRAAASAAAGMGGRGESNEEQAAGAVVEPNPLYIVTGAMADPVLLIDGEDRVTTVNAAGGKVLGVIPAVAVKKKLSEVGDAEAGGALVELLGVIRRGATYGQVEVKASVEGVRRTYNAVAVGQPRGAVVMVLRDVTEMVAAGQMKTDFVANASHELRTPIAAIKTAVETLSECLRDDPEQAERCLAIVAGQARRLEDMVADLLDLSRVEGSEAVAEVKAVAVGEVVGAVRAGLEGAAAEKGVELGFEVDEAAVVETDPRLMHLILRNLVENAVKFTAEGGRVSVKVEGSGANYKVIVEDTGIGIPPEHRERVFERFYQVNVARTGGGARGTGLGLAIVKHAVAALGGAVKLESEVGRGTRVECAFGE